MITEQKYKTEKRMLKVWKGLLWKGLISFISVDIFFTCNSSKKKYRKQQKEHGTH